MDKQQIQNDVRLKFLMFLHLFSDAPTITTFLAFGFIPRTLEPLLVLRFSPILILFLSRWQRV